MSEKTPRKLFQKLTHKYRMVLLNEDTFEEVGNMRLTRLNLIALVGIILILLVTITYILIAYTSIRELIPGYPDAAMRQHIAADLQLEPTRVNVKATTTERLGFTGRGEGIAAFAVVLLEEPGNR